MLLTLLSTARTLRMAYDRAAEVGRQEPAGVSQNAERYCRMIQIYNYLSGFTVIAGTGKLPHVTERRTGKLPHATVRGTGKLPHATCPNFKY